MKLQKIITNSLLGIGLIGFLGCDYKESKEQAEKTEIKNYVAEFSAFSNSGAGVAVGDMNGDGKLDIVIASPGSKGMYTIGKVYVFLNNGDGTYSP